VFARGGSQRVKDKNLRKLGNETLLEKSIQSGMKIVSPEQIWVSTDSDPIAGVAQDSGVNVIRRGPELAGNSASEWRAWRHAVEHVQRLCESFTTFLSLPTTAPLRTTEDVLGCLSLLDGSADCVVTATPAKNNPHFNMVVCDDEGMVRPVIGGSVVGSMQEAPRVFDMTTVAYATRPDYILSRENLWDGNVKAYVVPEERALDIDTEWDFRLATLIVEDMRER
jgi:CMP-N-acetylneuraminic acid synthetase